MTKPSFADLQQQTQARIADADRTLARERVAIEQAAAKASSARASAVAKAETELATEVARRKLALCKDIASALAGPMREFILSDQRSIAGEIMTVWAALCSRAVAETGETPHVQHLSFSMAVACFGADDERLNDSAVWQACVDATGPCARATTPAMMRTLLLKLESDLTAAMATGRPDSSGRFAAVCVGSLSHRDSVLAAEAFDKACAAEALAEHARNYRPPTPPPAFDANDRPVLHGTPYGYDSTTNGPFMARLRSAMRL